MLDQIYQYPSRNFERVLEEARNKLRQVGQGGKESGIEYERVKKMLIDYSRSLNNYIIFDSQSDIRRVLSVLIQEVSVDDDILRLLIANAKFNPLFKAIGEQIDDEYKILITKKMLSLYYGRYFSFESLSTDEKIYFYQLLKMLIEDFDGKTIMVLKAKENKEILAGNLKKCIAKHGSLEKIFQELVFLKHFEIWQRIRIIFLLEEVKKWQVNQWDGNVASVLEQVLEYRDVVVGQRNLLEETTFLVLQKCKSVNHIIDNWLNFIFKHIGDPRILRHQDVWFRIGEEYYRWLRAKLSQEDVRAFLENMTDGQGDDVYQYRRQFWLQYIKHIQYAKVMLGNTGLNYVAKMNSDMYQRFKSSPETYSRLNDNQRSCILMDFGSFFVIEGTHNAKLRIYKELPIRLVKRNYEYGEFYLGAAAEKLLQDFSHHYSEGYTWQNQVRRFIIDNFNINVKLEDVVLEEDKRRLTIIKEHLFNKNQSIL